jgi:protoporphyrinogen oxidase
MKKIVVVGGGISGCISALYLAEKNYQVDLFENFSNLGGIMRDYSFNNQVYLSSPHYLKTNSEWIKKLLKFKNIKKTLRKINVHYGSYNDLFGKEIFYENFAHPTTLAKFKCITKKISNTLLSRLQCYQSNISIPLVTWLKKFNNKYDKIHCNCSKILAIGRVFFLNDIKKINLLKKKDTVYDELLGVPNFKYGSNQAFLPVKGFNNFFFELKKILKKKGVKIHSEEKILLKKNNSGKLNIFNNKDEIICDHVLWTANPVPLIKNLEDKLLDNPFSKCFLLFINFCKVSKNIKDSYIQVFSKKSNITRIFVYKSYNIFKLTAEGVFTSKEINFEEEVNFIKKVLKKFFPGSQIQNTFQIKKILRHNLYTVRDFNLMEKVFTNKYHKKFIHGSWHIYNRDEKIINILENIKKVGL